MSQPILQIEKATKMFPGVRALQDVDFSVERGEIHALVGKNGAGKSTLIKAITGIYTLDFGTVSIDSEVVHHVSARKMYEMGVDAIYQVNDLVPYFTVGQSIMLNTEPTAMGGLFVRRKEMHETARAVLLNRLGFDCDPYRLISELNVSERQLVQIAKCLVREPRVLIFDEPTGPLAQAEIDRLFEIIRSLRDAGVSIIYISHRLEEIFEIADTVTVMRDGKKVADMTIDGHLQEKDIIRYMTGGATELGDARREHTTATEAVVLKAESLTNDQIADVSFELHEGEILGVFGAEGAGQQVLANTLFGLYESSKGTISVDGKSVEIRHPADAVRHGLGYVPRDRREEGLVQDFSLAENVTLADLDRYCNRSLIDFGREQQTAREMVDRLQIATSSIEKLARYLSGGNQQKTVIARWLVLNPKVLLLDYPTIGIDVQAKEEVYRIIRSIAAEKKGVILITPEYEEIHALCDKVIVFRQGHVVGQFDVDDVDEDLILSFAIGSGKEPDNIEGTKNDQ